jgi:D-psicose/D-tagatose/L-ribulose 3-epimerase
MKLGMNMLLWGADVTGPEYGPTFEMLADAGYEGIEVPIFGGADPQALGALGDRLRALGFDVLGVTARSEDDSPISADPEVRARALEATNAAVDACAALGARALCGPIEAPLGVFSGGAPTDDERKR